MAYLLFVDESGQDRRESPYEVLAGVAVPDAALWPLVCRIRLLEEEAFGGRYAADERELKGKKILKRKVYRQAAQLPPIALDERRAGAARALADGASATRDDLTALAQAKLWFVEAVFRACAEAGCAVIASVVLPDAPSSARDFLRKDYAYLFERFFHLVETRRDGGQGLVVFDELERVQSHLLVDQMARYFQETVTGRRRAARVIPEPFFVHSHLTTGVQLADLVAYVISWNVRVGQMGVDRREEMDPLGDAVRRLAPRLAAGQGPRGGAIQPIAVISDLRPRIERGEPAGKRKGNAGEPAKPPPT